MSLKGKILLGLAALVVLYIGGRTVCNMMKSDEDLIRDVVYDMAAAAENRNARDFLYHVHEKFSTPLYGEMNKKVLARWVTGLFLRERDGLTVKIDEVDVEFKSASLPAPAVVRFTLGLGKKTPAAYALAVEFVKHDGRWIVISVDRYTEDG